MIMEGDPFLLIEGMAIAGIAVGATKGYIYIRSEYPHAIAIMNGRSKCASGRRAGPSVLGSGHAFDIEIRVGAGAYVCGEETSLLESLEGKRGMVRAKPPLPAHKGLFGKPTVVNNVISLASVPMILAAARPLQGFRHRPLARHAPIQLAGNIRRGGLFEAAFGITLGEIIDDIGGGTASGRPVRAVQVGGPLGAYCPRAVRHADGLRGVRREGGLIGHGGIVVFDDRVDMLSRRASPSSSAPTKAAANARPAASARCAASRTCRGSRAKIEPAKGRRIQDLCNTMKFGSLCALGRFTPLSGDERDHAFPGRLPSYAGTTT